MIQRVNAEWTAQGRASGLLRGIVSLPDGFGQQVDIRAYVDEQEVFSGAGHRHHDGRMHVNFNTHLIPNGKHALRIDVIDGNAAVTAQGSYDIHNVGSLAEDVRDSFRNAGVPLVYVGDSDHSIYAPAERLLKAWTDLPDAGQRVDEMESRGQVSASEADMLRRFLRDGFVVLDEKLPEPMIDAANKAMDDAIASGYQGFQEGSSQRLEQMHVHYPAIRDIWLHGPVHRFLSLVFGAESQPCQSLVYVNGSQQDAHQDTIHLTPFPAGLMSGVWIALEDVRLGAGELAVYPGSHRLPRVYMETDGTSKVRGDWTEFGEKVVSRWRALLDESGLAPVPYVAKRGDILIWHENLMHAGTLRTDKSLSRRSIVTHNFAKGGVVYYDSSGDVGHIHDAQR